METDNNRVNPLTPTLSRRAREYKLKSLFWQIVNSIIKICLEIFVFDRKIRRILKGNWAKFYLRKWVEKGVGIYKQPPHPNPLPQGEGTSAEPDEKLASTLTSIEGTMLWQYWESPNGEVPPLVQACMNSVEKYKGNHERVFLTYETIKDYVELPAEIYELKEKGKMNTAHFADILRTALLVQYGGVWIDATVLLTETLPDFVDTDLFFFQNDVKVDLDGLCGTNYFISAKAGNKILTQTLNAMLAYWTENNFLVNYFTHMHMITMICKKNPDLFNKIPFFSFYPVQQLQRELLNKFSAERWEQLKKSSPIHKLTHKKAVLTKKKEFSTDGTFFEYIIKEFV